MVKKKNKVVKFTTTKDKIVAALLAFFLGGFGIHWFYLGNKNKGLIYLLVSIFGSILIFPTFVIGVLALIDAIVFLTKSKEDWLEFCKENNYK